MAVKAGRSNLLSIDYESLTKLLSSAPKDDIYKVIVNAPFTNKSDMALLFMGFICLYVVDEGKSQIQLMAASGTDEYRLAVERYNFKPSQFHLRFDEDKNNTIVQAIVRGRLQDTTDWVTVSRKNKSPEIVRINQANSGIAYTAIYPFSSSVRGALMYNFYQYHDKIDEKQRTFMKKYTHLVSSYLASQKIVQTKK